MELQSNALSWFTEISRTIVLISLCCSIHRGQQAVSFPGRKGIPRTLVVNRDEHPTNGLTRELFFICSAYITQVYQPNSLESNFPFLYKVNQESSSSQGHFFFRQWQTVVKLYILIRAVSRKILSWFPSMAM